MKIIAATLALSVMLPSVVRAQAIEDDGTCPKLAEHFKTIYFGFPDIKKDSIARIASWKASCASKAPVGKENVVALCTAHMTSEGSVFFWIKAGVESELSGYEICDYP